MSASTEDVMVPPLTGVHELAVLLEVVDDEDPHARERPDPGIAVEGRHGSGASRRGR